MDERRQFGIRLDKLRIDNDLTVEALAEKLNVTAQHVRSLINGSGAPSMKMFYQICNILKASPAYLMADGLHIDEPEDVQILLQLYKTGTPKQLKILREMLEVFERNQ